jgi:beta-glucosidase-like glycosyl hydrolase
MNYLLKNELNFQGFIMSDWQAQHSGVGDILAGLDMVRIWLFQAESTLTFTSLCRETQPS